MKGLLAWLESRTGVARLAREYFYTNIPGGARWRYTWGGVLLFALAIQFVTGFFLWLNYSPGAQSAWESVYYMQNQMMGGWILRGLHHYGAQLLPVLLALHLFQLVAGGAYKAPREVNFWITLLLVQLVLATALTGYQLPWDQKGFWATKVAMNLLGIVPVVGQSLQRMLIGGADYGHLTLTRFFAVHAGFLPVLMVIVIVAQIQLRRRHGLAGDIFHRRPDAPFWPDQALRNAVVCLAFVLTLLLLTVGHQSEKGVELGAPADPSAPYAAARPEWYFLFLYEFLRFFPGRSEIWGAVVIPGAVMLMIALMPLIARWHRRGHGFNVAFLSLILVGAGVLFALAKSDDAHNAEYLAAVKDARVQADRVKLLAAAQGIPPGGALALLHADPLTEGPKLFAQNCASCHRYHGTDGLGHAGSGAESASDLAGFASREWLAGLLDPQRITASNYFGGTKFKDSKMVRFVNKDLGKLTDDDRGKLQQLVAALSAEAHLKSQAAGDQRDAEVITKGRGLLTDDFDCVKCHKFGDQSGESAPDLTGYGSREWLERFLHNPAHPDFYDTDNDRMPAFGEKKLLTSEQIDVIADWLRGDWVQ